jgi:inhibitor of cysteine peptidase
MKAPIGKKLLKRAGKSTSLMCFAAAICAALVLGMAPAQVSAKSRAVGTSYMFTLDGNPGTGFKWILNEQASSGIEFVNVESLGYQEPTKTGKKLIGAPAPFAFRITCLSAGFAHLIFDYVPPGGGAAGQTHETWARCE